MQTHSILQSIKNDLNRTHELTGTPGLINAQLIYNSVELKFFNDRIDLTFKTEEAQLAFFQKIKDEAAVNNLVVFDRNDEDPRCIGIRLRLEAVNERKFVRHIIELLQQYFPKPAELKTNALDQAKYLSREKLRQRNAANTNANLLELKGEACDTLYYQGNGGSQTQVVKYMGNRMVKASTGEWMWCDGKNGLKPLNIIYRPFLAPEIADVDLHPFNTVLSHLNPVKLAGTFITYGWSCLNNVNFGNVNQLGESVRFHAPNLSKISIGQETDIQSHRQKFDNWFWSNNRSKHLICMGVSRGTAATFNALCEMEESKLEPIKLVILEGAIDSVPAVLSKRVSNIFSHPTTAKIMTAVVNKGLSLFTAYKTDGPSPINNVDKFPKNIPVVFITSEADTIVPCENTENIATKLARKGDNDVYLLKLKKPSHPDYMFDNKKDRDDYEHFIHAIYKRYHLKHDSELAEKGQMIMDQCLLASPQKAMSLAPR